MRTTFTDHTRTVKTAAQGRWPDILQSLGGLEERQTDPRTRKTGAPCPLCGGHDRYSFKHADHGGWACRHCGGGDGWKLLMEINRWTFPEAVRQVGGYLSCINDPPATSKREAPASRNESEFMAEQEAMRRAQDHKRTATWCQQLWASSRPADPSHPYLVKKHLPPFDLRQTTHRVYGWCLLVPLHNEHGDLVNLEYINPEGMKRPVKNAQRQGTCYQFGTPEGEKIYIAESWGTGAAIHLGTNRQSSVLASMTTVNLALVAGIACRRFPDRQVIIAADNDPGGRLHAINAATKHNLKIVIPEKPGSDFWDSWRDA